MHRGELESRLRQAHGNAMDLDGLSYESLVELTDRVGVAGPSDGSAFLGLSAEDLDKNSFTFSPALYLSEPENGRNCPICLGSYDVTDETDSLRELYNCAHVFHTACLETWLKTKPSCPLCKTCIVAEEEQP
jgi:Ring finger domain